MSFPAFDDFAQDRGVGLVTFKVYMHLVRDVLDIHEPRTAKVAGLVDSLKMRPASVLVGINWLVANGYLIEHARGHRGMRSFTIAWKRKTQPPETPETVAVRNIA